MSARVTQEESWEFNELMRGYRDEIRAETAAAEQPGACAMLTASTEATQGSQGDGGALH